VSAYRRPVGELLRRHRLAAGLSQEALAERAGLSRRGVSDIERGLIGAPHLDTLTRLADALELTLAERNALQVSARAQRIPQVAEPSQPLHGAVAIQPALVGRQQELALIERHLAGGTVPLLALAGEPGIGKSRLLAETASRAASQGWRVIAGGCTRRSGQAPYEPIVSALAREVRWTPPARRRLDLQGCAWLVRLLPELLETQIAPAPVWSLPSDQERRLMFGAVARFLANIAGPAGTLLLLDDLQWAASDALSLLESLVREASEREESAPLRMMAAYRATEVRLEDPLGLLLADLARDGLATRRQLDLLRPVEAAALLAELWPEDPRVSSAVREEALRRADGLPFYLVSSAHAFQDVLQSALADAAGSVGPVPVSVKESVQARVAALPTAARSLVGIAAVAGRTVSEALLLGIRPRQEETLEAFDTLLHAGLLAEDGVGTYRFTHDLIREVIEEDLGSHRRRTLHRRIAEELARATTDMRRGYAAEIAAHYVAAGERVSALPYALQAGDQAEAASAHAEAEGHFRTALDLSQDLSDKTQEAIVSEKLGGVFMIQSRQRDALTSLERAASVYLEIGAGEGLLRVSARLARLYDEMGRPGEGLERFAPVAAAAEESGLYTSSPGLARLYYVLAGLYARKVRRPDDLVAMKRAEQLARAAHDDTILAQILARRSRTAHIIRDDDDAPDPHDVLPLAERVRDPQVLFEILGTLAGIHLERGELESASVYCQRNLTLAEQIQDFIQIASSFIGIGELDEYRGDWRHARERFEQAASIHAQLTHTGNPFTAVYVPLRLAMLDTYEGRGKQVAAVLEESAALAQQRNDRPGEAFAIRTLAERDLIEGRARTAYQRLAMLLSKQGIQDWEWLMVLTLPYQAWAELELGQLERAARTSQDCVDRARARSFKLGLVDALRAQALINVHCGDHEPARQGLEEALTLCRAIGYPYSEAKALWVYGQLEANRGDRRTLPSTHRARDAIPDAEDVMHGRLTTCPSTASYTAMYACCHVDSPVTLSALIRHLTSLAAGRTT
jgi:transcriptional regulator with XRE-family HTH domain/tetratricopeptide (TPR) repeat protein